MFICYGHVQLFEILQTMALQAPLSMGFSRQEYWSGLPCPPPGESSRSRDWTWVSNISCIGRLVLYCQHHLQSPQKMPLLLFSLSVVSDSLPPHGLQHARLPSPSSSPGACSNSCPLSQWCHLTIFSSVVPSPPVFSLSQHQGLFQWVISLHQVAKVLELHL